MLQLDLGGSAVSSKQAQVDVSDYTWVGALLFFQGRRRWMRPQHLSGSAVSSILSRRKWMLQLDLGGSAVSSNPSRRMDGMEPSPFRPHWYGS